MIDSVTDGMGPTAEQESPWTAVHDRLVGESDLGHDAGDPAIWRLWETASAAGYALQDAVGQLAHEWVGDREVAPPQVDAVVLSKRYSLDQKVYLLRLLALEAIERATKFELAMRIAVNLDSDLSWNEMAKLVGRSRQALHREYSDLVREIKSGTDDEVADLASRLGALPPQSE